MYKKHDLPKKEDLVICTITEATPSSVFVTLDEYDKVTGMVHVSEISRKFVRGMKTYLKTGSKMVCEVMSVDAGKKFIELSMRRAGEGQKRTKLKEWDNERKANDVLEVFAKQNSLSAKDAHDKIGNKILDKFGLLFPTFIEIAKVGEAKLAEAGVEKPLAHDLAELIQKRITLPKAEISGTITITSRSPSGVEVIKRLVAGAQETAKKRKTSLSVQYLGAPKYKFRITAEDFKAAEETFKLLKEQMEKSAAASDGTAAFERE